MMLMDEAVDRGRFEYWSDDNESLAVHGVNQRSLLDVLCLPSKINFLFLVVIMFFLERTTVPLSSHSCPREIIMWFKSWKIFVSVASDDRLDIERWPF